MLFDHLIVIHLFELFDEFRVILQDGFSLPEWLNLITITHPISLLKPREAIPQNQDLLLDLWMQLLLRLGVYLKSMIISEVSVE